MLTLKNSKVRMRALQRDWIRQSETRYMFAAVRETYKAILGKIKHLVPRDKPLLDRLWNQRTHAFKLYMHIQDIQHRSWKNETCRALNCGWLRVRLLHTSTTLFTGRIAVNGEPTIAEVLLLIQR